MILRLLIIIVIILAVAAVTLVTLLAMVKVYRKAHQPSWAIIVPFYHEWTLAKIGGKPAWWGLLASSPIIIRIDPGSQGTFSTSALVVLAGIALVSLYFYLMICIGVARNFSKSEAFGLVLMFLPFIGYPMLAAKGVKYSPKKAKKTKSEPWSTIS